MGDVPIMLPDVDPAIIRRDAHETVAATDVEIRAVVEHLVNRFKVHLFSLNLHYRYIVLENGKNTIEKTLMESTTYVRPKKPSKINDLRPLFPARKYSVRPEWSGSGPSTKAFRSFALP